MQEPNAIDCSSQVATTTASVLSIGGGVLPCELGRMVNEEAGAGVGTMVAGDGAQGGSNNSLVPALVLLEVTQLTKAVHNNKAGLHKPNKGLEVE